MICVKVEMWPLGSEHRKYELGRAYIANVGGDSTRGDYDVAVCRRGTTDVPGFITGQPTPKATRTGNVTRYPRLAYNMWRLIIRALRSAFPEEDRRGPFPQPFDGGIGMSAKPVPVDDESILAEKLERKEAEIVRLRAALEEIANASGGVQLACPDIAREALEGSR
jgi:hypothetical protein